MKKRNLLAALASLVIAFAAPNIAHAGETVRVKVLGLVCDFCAQAIEKVFMKTDLVETINVNLDEALITIVMKERETFTDESITKNVTDAGYNVEGIERITTQEEKAQDHE